MLSHGNGHASAMHLARALPTTVPPALGKGICRKTVEQALSQHRLATPSSDASCAMALPVTPELMDLLTRQLDAPIEWVSVVGQCSLAPVRGIAVSAGRVLDFVFDAERQQLHTWLRFELTTLQLTELMPQHA